MRITISVILLLITTGLQSLFGQEQPVLQFLTPTILKLKAGPGSQHTLQKANILHGEWKDLKTITVSLEGISLFTNLDTTTTSFYRTVSDSGRTFPISIQQQPVSTSVTRGDTASFHVKVAAGSGVRYQWQRYGRDIPNATNSQLTLHNVQPSDAGAYAVRLFYEPTLKLISSLPLGRPQSVSLYTTNAYVTAIDGTLTIVNISDPTQPKTTTTWRSITNSTKHITLNGIYSARVYDHYLTCFSGSTFSVIDVIDPLTLKLVSNIELHDARIISYDINDGIAYISTLEGMYIVDLKDPNNPNILSRHLPLEYGLTMHGDHSAFTYWIYFLNSVHAGNGYAYVGSREYMAFVNATALDSPKLIAPIIFGESNLRFKMPFTIQGDMLYRATATHITPISLKDPDLFSTVPRPAEDEYPFFQTWNKAFTAQALMIRAKDTHAVTIGTSGVMLYDLVEPMRPVMKSLIDTSEAEAPFYVDATYEPPYLFVCDDAMVGSGKLRVFEINPESDAVASESVTLEVTNDGQRGAVYMVKPSIAVVAKDQASSELSIDLEQGIALECQWQINGMNLNGKTNRSMTVKNIGNVMDATASEYRARVIHPPRIKRIVKMDFDASTGAAWVEGDTSYVVNKKAMQVVIESRVDPDNPIELANINVGEYEVITDINVKDGILCVVGVTKWDAAGQVPPRLKLKAFDVTEQKNPKVIGESNDLTRQRFDTVMYIKVHDEFVYCLTDRLHVFDVRGRNGLVKIGEFSVNDGFAHPFCISGARLLLLVENGVNIVDITNPTKCMVVGKYRDNDNNGSPGGIDVVGKTIYATWSKCLKIIDFSDDIRPWLCGGRNNQNVLSTESLSGIQVVDGVAYVEATGYGAGVSFSNIDAIDITNPRVPVFLGRYGTYASGWSQAREHGYDLGYQMTIQVVNKHIYCHTRYGLDVMAIEDAGGVEYSNPLMLKAR